MPNYYIFVVFFLARLQTKLALIYSWSFSFSQGQKEFLKLLHLEKPQRFLISMKVI